MTVAVMPERGVYVTFELRPVEDREATIKAGHMVYRDVEYAIVTPSGGKLVVEKECTPEVIAKYRPQYDAWKAGLEEPVAGTHVRNWPGATPAEVKTLLEHNVRTVEDAAAMSEQTIQRLGMGGRRLKDKAAAWLKAADGPGRVAEQLAALQVRLETLEREGTEKDATIATLSAQVDLLKGEAPAQPRAARRGAA